ncbi:MAG: hypothetical protein AAF481_09685 [Acidobacteriota bacterium]
MKRLLLAGLLALATLAVWQVVAGPKKQLGTYSYWAWSSQDHLAEAVKIHLLGEDEESTVLWLIVTPGGNRVTITDTHATDGGQAVTRLEDEESGWWAEYSHKMDPPDLTEVPWGTYTDFSMSIRFLTSDGLHAERTFGPGDPEGDQRYEDWVQAALELEESPAVLPKSTIEETRFLASLDVSKHVGLEHSAISTIAEAAALVAEAGSAGVQAPTYGTQWTEGEITGTASPAIEAVLERFKSDQTKRAVSWVRSEISGKP